MMGGQSQAIAESSARLQGMLEATGQEPVPPAQALALGEYLLLLVRWNSRINLTAIRGEDEMLRQHFAESVLCARLLPGGIKTLLDYGSGAGFPGLPCAIFHPAIHVTLAESQAKKVAFLREVVRTLGLATTVYDGRVEAMPGSPRFDAVTLRAVDKMRDACSGAAARLREGGWLVVLTTMNGLRDVTEAAAGLVWNAPVFIPGSKQKVLLLGRKTSI